jgi:hypothetical protein
VGALKVALEGVASVVSGAADIGANLTRTSQQTGLAVSSVQELGYVAERTGVSATKLTTAVGMFERQLHLVEQGTGKRAANALNELGVSATDVATAMRTPGGMNQLLFEVSDKLAAMPNTGERAAIMLELFGRQSGAVGAALAQGSRALKEQIQHFKDLGAEISDEQVGALQNLKTKIVDLHVSWEAFKTKAVAALAPLLERLITAFTDLAHVVGDAMVRASEILQDHWGELIALVGGLVTAFIALRAEALLTGLLAAAPFVLMAVLIGALILIVNDLWVGFHGGRSVLLDLGQAFVDWVKVAHPAIYSIIEVAEQVGEKLIEIAHKLGLVGREARALAALTDKHHSDDRISNLESQETTAGETYAKLRSDLEDAKAGRGAGGTAMVPAIEQALQVKATQLQQIKTQLDAEKLHRNKLQDDYGDPDDKDKNYYQVYNHVASKTDTSPWANAGQNAPAAGPSVTVGELHVHSASGDPKDTEKAVKDALNDLAGSLSNLIPSGKVRR